jgi:hypothetical protein
MVGFRRIHLTAGRRTRTVSGCAWERPVGGSAIAVLGMAKVKPGLEKITNLDP